MLEWTHCTLVCDSEWVTSFFIAHFWNEWLAFLLHIFEYPLKWFAYSTIWLLHGWCHVKLLQSWCTFCVHHTAMHQLTVSLHAKLLCWDCNTECHVPMAVLVTYMNKLTRLGAFAVSPLWSLDISWCLLYNCVKYFHYTQWATSKQLHKWWPWKKQKEA